MAYAPKQQRRAERLFVDRGMTIEQVAEETKIAASTLKRWSRRFEWAEQRRLRALLERQSLELANELAAAAKESRDPQQAFAAQRAIALLGGGASRDDTGYPPPSDVAIALLDAMSNHIELGPLVRRHKGELIRLSLAALKQFEQTAGSA